MDNICKGCPPLKAVQGLRVPAEGLFPVGPQRDQHPEAQNSPTEDPVPGRQPQDPHHGAAEPPAVHTQPCVSPEVVLEQEWVRSELGSPGLLRCGLGAHIQPPPWPGLNQDYFYKA